MLMCHSVGTDGIIKKIRDTVGDRPVYLSIDVRHLIQVSRVLQYLASISD